ncbi:hypothetical protein LT493_29680 [Streptomyces tricolor]|nr:hypothetical protein [Streptomyces tricolor]
MGDDELPGKPGPWSTCAGRGRPGPRRVETGLGLVQSCWDLGLQRGVARPVMSQGEDAVRCPGSTSRRQPPAVRRKRVRRAARGGVRGRRPAAAPCGRCPRRVRGAGSW